LPQHVEHLFRFKIGDRVRIDLPAKARNWPFKYSLNRGRGTFSMFLIFDMLYITYIAGRVHQEQGVVTARQLTRTQGSTVTPFYSVRLGKKQVQKTYSPFKIGEKNKIFFSGYIFDPGDKSPRDTNHNCPLKY